MLNSKAIVLFSSALFTFGANAVVCQTNMVRNNGALIQEYFAEGFSEAEACKEVRKTCSLELRKAQRAGQFQNADCILIGLVNTIPGPGNGNGPGAGQGNGHGNGNGQGPGNGHGNPHPGQYDYQLNDIEDVLSRGGWQARQYAVQDLVRFPSARALAIAIKATSDSDNNVRNAAVNSANKLMNSIDMAYESFEVIRVITPMLKSNAWRQRQMAAIALGRVMTAEAIIPLIDAASDNDNDVRNAVNSSINRLLNERDLKQVVNRNKVIMERFAVDNNWQTRLLTMKVLKVTATPRMIEMAVKATGDIDTDVRAEAARAVKAIVLAPNYINNSNAFINDLIALYRSSNWQVRMYSIFALGETRNYMARSTIISALDDRDADVRNSARNALNKI